MDFMDRMIAEQPFVGAYLMAVEEVWMPAEERGGLLLIGLIVWQAMSAGQGRIRAVTTEEIDALAREGVVKTSSSGT